MRKQQIGNRKASLGIVGFGAFGQLAARHLGEHFSLSACDPSAEVDAIARHIGVDITSLEAVARCDIIVIASPVACLEDVVGKVACFCRPGALIVDVGSVKVGPSQILQRLLPNDVNVIATHPLFGPQSARTSIQGLKIAVCPVRGTKVKAFLDFLEETLGLDVILTTPEEHDREAAIVQGLTHLIAKVLNKMGPLPTRMTTKSFDLLSEAISMVQHDAPEVFEAIEKDNPYAKDVRQRFFDLADDLRLELDADSHS